MLIRVTPDIDIDGHAAVTTGVNDQKFGFALADDRAADGAKRILHQPLLDLVGLHCHIGSQITDPMLYGEAIRRMIAAMADIRARHGVHPARTQHRRRARQCPTSAAIPSSTSPSWPTSSTTRLIGRARPNDSRVRVWLSSRARHQRPRRGDAVPGGFGEIAAGRAHVRRGGRRHVRQPARRALRCEIHCGAGQPALARPDQWSRSPDGIANPATRSPATSSCPPTSIPVICWRSRAPAPISTAWRRTTTWWAVRRSSPSGTASRPRSCAARRRRPSRPRPRMVRRLVALHD